MNIFFKTLLLSFLYSISIMAMLPITPEKNENNSSKTLEVLPLELIKLITSRNPSKECLHYRLVSKKLSSLDSMPTALYNTYNKDKYISPVCAFLDCVKDNNIPAIKWFFDNDLYSPLRFLTSCYNQAYVSLSPFKIVKNNDPLLKLLKENIKADHPRIDTEHNYDLCLTSCIGNIDGFEKELSNKNNNDINKKSIPLVIWAATKNGDIDFLKNLLTHKDYKAYMERNSDKFLRFAFVGRAFESFDEYDFAFVSEITTTPNLERIKKLIDSKCFVLGKKNYDCQSSWDNHAIAYLDHIKTINPIFKEMHTYALQKLMNELDEENMKILKNKLLIGSGLLTLVGIFYYYSYNDK